MKRVTIILILLLIFAGNIFSQKIFFNKYKKIMDNTLAHPTGLATGDMDKDGFKDIVVSSSKNNSIFWFRNKPNLSSGFDKPKVVTTDFDGASDIILADIDNDNDKDIISIEKRRKRISWFENINNSSTFVEHKINNETFGIYHIELCDIDSDGDLDVLVSYWENGRISYFENIDGHGTFSGEIVIKKDIDIVSCVKFEDVDGDNKKDIIAALYTQNQLVWYKNNGGTNNFSDKHIINQDFSHPSTLALYDLYGNNTLDIVAYGNNSITLFINGGNGNFVENRKLAGTNYSSEKIVFADANTDGKIDIFYNEVQNNKINLLLNTGNEKFDTLITVIDNLSGLKAYGLADFDLNGNIDICGASLYDSNLIWKKNNAGNFEQPITIFKPLVVNPNVVLVDDFNNDNKPDIVLANQRGNTLLWYAGVDNNIFDYRIIEPKDEGQKYSIKCLMDKSDLDNDNDMDLVYVKNQYNSEIYLYKNTDGKGNFEKEKVNLLNNINIDFLRVFDIDSDNKPDIVFLSKSNNKISYIKNNGNTGFESSPLAISDNFEKPSGFIEGDYDNDGDIDIIAISYNNGVLVYFENNNNVFTKKNNVFTSDYIDLPLFITTADIDNDNDLDIIYSTYSAGIYYALNNGNGTFAQAQQLNLNIKLVKQIIMNDLDNDGDLDILIKNSHIYWCENTNGKGNFSEAMPVIEDNTVVHYMATGDFNADTYKDVISISNEANALLLNLNDVAPVLLKQPVDYTRCDTGKAYFEVNYDKADSVIWQEQKKYTHTFLTVNDNDIYTGTKTKKLDINANIDLNGYKYRAAIYYKGIVFYSDTAILHVDKYIEANAGEDQGACYDHSYLSGNSPVQGYGWWTVIEGSATILNPSKPYTRVNDLSFGNNVFEWTITNGTCQSHSTVTITKYDSVFITNNLENKSVNAGEDVSFVVNTTGHVKAYQWLFNGQALSDNDRIQGSTTNKLTIKNTVSSDAGHYLCKVIGDCNIGYTDNVLLDVITATYDIENRFYNVYPNPVNNVLTIESENNINKFILKDINGKVIRIKPVKTGNYNNIDLSKLQQGIYILSIFSENKRYLYKIVKL